ncbi:GATA transcription factor 2-like [Salvia miltiorrhiza]|uniref:GATA transcription factor 2-like n=1 Tax=Salvia miltiorrhiza TaxID=226208 RepID=UPI0025AC267E|nr:GATA transcription factor 2-like [Salvia miltiorrhiza]
MDAYGALSVDDLLDLPNDDFLSSSSSSSAAAAAANADFLLHHPSSAANAHFEDSPLPTNYSTDFTDIFRVPTEDAAELEWLSNYMDDSFTDFPASELASASVNFHGMSGKGFHGRARSKRSRPVTSAGENQAPGGGGAEVARRCTHCASEKTPQWRTGPLGPKTLCNACGVRYKSGRLVPEYRPAASPTFVLTQHSNSHRKVMELRRQKDLLRQQQQQQEAYGRHFRVC